MSDTKGFSSAAPWLASALFGLFVWWLLPAGVVAMDDDFGYLRSAVETLQRHRPWTDDWLAPWSAPLSALTALLYRATGSFERAIHLTLALGGALAFHGAARLFRARAFSGGEALVGSALLLCFPTISWKVVEFTGVALYLPFLLLALGAAERKRWRWFLLWWALGIATRQSAAAWAAMPLAELGRLITVRRGPRWRRQALTLGGVCLVGAGVVLLMKSGMNKTHAQRLVTDHPLERIAWGAALRGWIAGGAVFFGAAGLGALMLGWRGKAAARWPGPRAAAGAAILGAALGWVALRGWVAVDHPLLSHAAGRFYGSMLLAGALAGWLMLGASVALRREHLFYAGASLCLVSLLSPVWDYYLIDIGLFGFFGVSAAAPTAATMTTATARERMPLGWLRAAGVLLVVCQAGMIVQVKCLLDRRRAACFLAEEALRSKRLDHSELSFAPFGLRGWYLYPWFIAHEGRADPNIAGFEGYLRPEAVRIEYAYPVLGRAPLRLPDTPAAGQDGLIAVSRCRLAWFFWMDCALRRASGDGAPAPALLAWPRGYEPPPSFPINDAEWDALIAAPPASPTRR